MNAENRKQLEDDCLLGWKNRARKADKIQEQSGQGRNLPGLMDKEELTHCPDDGSSKHLSNFGQFLRDHTVTHPRRQSSSYTPPRKPGISLQNSRWYHTRNSYFVHLTTSPMCYVTLWLKITKHYCSLYIWYVSDTWNWQHYYPQFNYMYTQSLFEQIACSESQQKAVSWKI
jgi:hypothetical protein